MLEISTKLEEALNRAFIKIFPKEDRSSKTSSILIGSNLVPASKPEFGDFQINCALSLAKEIKQPPRDIAQQIADQLQKDNDFVKICNPPLIAGPGFINLSINSKTLISEIHFRLNDKRLGVPLKKFNTDKTVEGKNNNRVIIDFSSPNIAKEMHVGHLRSTIIGDSLARVLEFCGYEVLRLNHVGDWGTQFGMLITHLKEVVPEALHTKNVVEISDLVNFYRQAKKRFDEDQIFQNKSRSEVVSLQACDQKSLIAWQLLCNQSRKEFQKIYDRLDIKLTERGESFYNKFLVDVVNDLKNKNLLVNDQGAQCIFLDGVVGKDGKPQPIIIQKSDGGFNYSTTDLAAIKYRLATPPYGDGAFRLIYVTDAGQASHFSGVFQIAKLANWIPTDCQIEHVPFGLVQGEDGKKLKTRSGETIRLVDLLDEAIQRAREDLKDRLKTESRSENESFIDKVATTVGIAAIKYADLSQNRVSNYQFSFDKMLSLQGNTAPYLLYALVRIAGISRKGGDLNVSSQNIQFNEPQEWALIRKLLQLDCIIDEVEKELLPNRLCGYLFELSQIFNRFYDQVPILKASEPSRTSRLALCSITADTLKLGMSLLGIPTLERM
ncbi:arginine--tRNA ligase [Prochlorococcus marinus]|uniref:arginine--tRNA ligase n=1 Tax=Prochlorococcus marinus TaxID=1219 RepID=UPI0022B36BA6|nr:arginine--tRNA ligase [Prochlorococcus marinus]